MLLAGVIMSLRVSNTNRSHLNDRYRPFTCLDLGIGLIKLYSYRSLNTSTMLYDYDDGIQILTVYELEG